MSKLWNAINDKYDAGELTKADWVAYVRDALRLDLHEVMQPLLQLGIIEGFVRDERAWSALVADIQRELVR